MDMVSRVQILDEAVGVSIRDSINGISMNPKSG